MEVFAAHDRCHRAGGLFVIVLPNFRGTVQLAYHRFFDQSNLKYHNLAIMDPGKLKKCGEALGHEIVSCQYMRRLRFWGFDRAGNKLRVAARAFAAICIRIYVILLSTLLPKDHIAFAPYIVYIARKLGAERKWGQA